MKKRTHFFQNSYPDNFWIDLVHHKVHVQVGSIGHVDDTLLFIFKFFPSSFAFFFGKMFINLVLQESIVFMDLPNVIFVLQY